MDSWKPYHSKLHEYKPHTYDRVHEYRKVHEYNHIHVHTYQEYKSSYRPEYHDYTTSTKNKTLRLTHPSPPPKEVRKKVKKRYGNLHSCYTLPTGPDIKVKEHVYKEYHKSEYQPMYREYNTSTEPYMNKKWTQYNGKVGYVLTSCNHYPFRWGRYDRRAVDENDNFTKESTQTSISKVNPVVYVEEPTAKTEQDRKDETVTTERDVHTEPVPFVAAAVSKDDVVSVKESAIEEPIEESGRWSALTSHGSEENVDGNLIPVEALVAGAVVGGAAASQGEPVPSNAETVDKAPTTESSAPAAETATVLVQSAPTVATVAMVTESAPPDVSTGSTNSGSKLPPEVVANIEAYNYVHVSEQSSIGTVKRTLDIV